MTVPPGSPGSPFQLPGSTPPGVGRDYTFVVRNHEDISIEFEVDASPSSSFQIVEAPQALAPAGDQAEFVLRLLHPTAGPVSGVLDIGASNRPTFSWVYFLEGTVQP